MKTHSKIATLLARLWLGLVVLVLAGPVWAGRVALVVGNSAYEHTVPLPNPRNDAEAMSEKLRQLGFDVYDGYDLSRTAFEDLIRNFSRNAQDADTAVLFYAGHGLEVGGINYLVPVDARIQDETDLKFETVTLTDILALMEREQRTNLVFLDACRDNPMTGNLARNMGTRSVSIGRGLAPVDTGVGTLIAYATQPGNIAFDGDGQHSPFTDALLDHIATPALDVELMMRQVRRDVMEKTNGQQVPWSNSSLTGGFVFQALPTQPAPPPTVVAVPASPDPQPDVPQDTPETAAVPQPPQSALPQTTVKPALPRQSPEPVADLTPDEEDIETAALLPPPSAVPPATLDTATEPDSDPLTAVELARRTQAELNRLGCNAGTEDGVWGRNSRTALERLAENTPAFTLTSTEPTSAALQQLEVLTGRICPLVCAATQNLVNDTCVTKTCPGGQRLSSKGTCYTPKAATSTRRSSPRARSGSSCFTYNGETFCQ